MKLLSIRHGEVTVRLSLEQCADLAKSSALAADHSLSEERETWQTQAALFQAWTRTGCAQWHMAPEDQATGETHLEALGLTDLITRYEREYITETPFFRTLLQESLATARGQNGPVAWRRRLSRRFEAVLKGAAGLFF